MLFLLSLQAAEKLMEMCRKEYTLAVAQFAEGHVDVDETMVAYLKEELTIATNDLKRLLRKATASE